MKLVINIRLTSELPLVRELAARLLKTGIQVVFCSEDDDNVNTPHIEQAANDLGIECLNFAREVESVSRLPKHPLQRRLMRMFGHFPKRDFDEHPGYQAHVSIVEKQKIAAQNLLTRANADSVLVVQDGVSGNCALIHIAIENKLRVFICPYGAFSTKDFDDYLDERHNDGTLVIVGPPFGDYIKRKAAHWIRSMPYGEALIYDPAVILARVENGLDIPLPWVVHGGLATTLFSESEVMHRSYIEQGIAPEKCVLAGTVYCDAMWDELRTQVQYMSAFENASRLVPNRLSVLVAVPPSYHASRSNMNEFEDYKAMALALARVGDNDPRIEVTLSLHPTTPEEDRAILKQAGVKLSDEWIVRLIPKHDVYISTFSSTIRWALACGKPVINYNAYGYKCADYSCVEAVFESRSIQACGDKLAWLVNEGNYEISAKSLRDVRRLWGVMDGKNFERIYQYMTK